MIELSELPCQVQGNVFAVEINTEHEVNYNKFPVNTLFVFVFILVASNI